MANLSVAEPKGELTLGGSRVRLDFNPSKNTTVNEIKVMGANFIDLCERLKTPYDGKPNEKNRCLAVAQTEVEAACMWAVKGATATIAQENPTTPEASK